MCQNDELDPQDNEQPATERRGLSILECLRSQQVLELNVQDDAKDTPSEGE